MLWLLEYLGTFHLLKGGLFNLGDTITRCQCPPRLWDGGTGLAGQDTVLLGSWPTTWCSWNLQRSKASGANLSWPLCAPHLGGEPQWCPWAPVTTEAGETQIHLPCLSAHWLSEQDQHTEWTVPAAAMAVVWLLCVLLRDAGQLGASSPWCWLQCPKHRLCTFQWLWSHLQFYPAVQTCHRAAPSSLMDIGAPPYARISSWWLVLSDWPFMGKYVLLRVWAFAMVALCPRRQGCSSCQLPALALRIWFSLWKRRGDRRILCAFGEECTAACESDLWHVLSTKNVRQAQHWGHPVGSTCAFVAVIAGSSSEQPPSNSHSCEEHNVQGKN